MVETSKNDISYHLTYCSRYSCHSRIYVASKSAFSIGRRVLDSFALLLTPKMTFVYAQDWLQTSHTPLMIEKCLFELETMKEG